MCAFIRCAPDAIRLTNDVTPDTLPNTLPQRKSSSSSSYHNYIGNCHDFFDDDHPFVSLLGGAAEALLHQRPETFATVEELEVLRMQTAGTADHQAATVANETRARAAAGATPRDWRRRSAACRLVLLYVVM